MTAITPPSPETIQATIEAALPNSVVTVSGDGYHYEARIVSPSFEGKNLMARHRLVYGALSAFMPAIHALSLKTLTPEQE